MEIKSYNKMYLSDVCENLGAMFEYAVACGYEPKVYWQYFINSQVALQIEKGNPKYLTGYSGRDLVDMVINSKPTKNRKIKGHLMNSKEILSFDEYYWAGWAIAHLQYETGFSFFHIEKCIPIKRVLELYSTLHEADITKFYDVSNSYLKEEKKQTNLKQIRLASGLTQVELAQQSGVEIRSIQMYEQKRNDINKAQVETLLKLSKVLGCNIEDLLE